MREDDERAGEGVEEPRQGTRLTAHQIHENVRRPAEEEMRRPASALLASSLAAGMLIGFSFLAASFARHHAPLHLTTVAAAAAYPLGFVFVVMGRSELFTENTLRPVIPLLDRRDGATLRGMLRMWGLLLAGNLAGAALLSLVLARTPMVPAHLHESLRATAAEAVSGGFGAVLYRAVFAGWLIALLAWLLSATRDSLAQLALVWLATAPISAFHFAHSIAGAVEAFYLAWRGETTWGAAAGGFVLPAVLGNTIGGVVLVALLNYGQVAEERSGER